jgi:hypothetical protein
MRISALFIWVCVCCFCASVVFVGGCAFSLLVKRNDHSLHVCSATHIFKFGGHPLTEFIPHLRARMMSWVDLSFLDHHHHRGVCVRQCFGMRCNQTPLDLNVVEWVSNDSDDDLSIGVP